MMMSKDQDFQFDSVFDADDYLYFYKDNLKEEYTKEEVDFLIRELPLKMGSRILDLACGYGRHANMFAGFGYHVTGVDRNQDFLDIAMEDAVRKSVHVTYRCSDSRSYVAPSTYDCVVHLFSSFGYFSDEENEQVIHNIACSLNPDGMFCLDILNRDAFLKDYPRFSVKEKENNLMIDRNQFDPISGRLYNSRIIMRDGNRRDAPFFLRLYNPTEIIRILSENGLSLIKIVGDWTGKPFDEYSKRMIIIARKTGDNPESS